MTKENTKKVSQDRNKMKEKEKIMINNKREKNHCDRFTYW